MIAVAVVLSVALLVGGGLLALRMVLAHKSKTLEHAPLAEMQRKMDEVEQRLLSGAMRR